jgi:hypothetical protein
MNELRTIARGTSHSSEPALKPLHVKHSYCCTTPRLQRLRSQIPPLSVRSAVNVRDAWDAAAIAAAAAWESHPAEARP